MLNTNGRWEMGKVRTFCFEVTWGSLDGWASMDMGVAEGADRKAVERREFF